MHQYYLMFEWRWVIYLYSLDVPEKISVAEILTINVTNFHVADTGFFFFFLTLDRVKFDSSSLRARKRKLHHFSLPTCLNFRDNRLSRDGSEPRFSRFLVWKYNRQMRAGIACW